MFYNALTVIVSRKQMVIVTFSSAAGNTLSVILTSEPKTWRDTDQWLPNADTPQKYWCKIPTNLVCFILRLCTCYFKTLKRLLFCEILTDFKKCFIQKNKNLAAPLKLSNLIFYSFTSFVKYTSMEAIFHWPQKVAQNVKGLSYKKQLKEQRCLACIRENWTLTVLESINRS